LLGFLVIFFGTLRPAKIMFALAKDTATLPGKPMAAQSTGPARLGLPEAATMHSLAVLRICFVFKGLLTGRKGFFFIFEGH
jgi:hypothetical protein